MFYFYLALYNQENVYNKKKKNITLKSTLTERYWWSILKISNNRNGSIFFKTFWKKIFLYSMLSLNADRTSTNSFSKIPTTLNDDITWGLTSFKALIRGGRTRLPKFKFSTKFHIGLHVILQIQIKKKNQNSLKIICEKIILTENPLEFNLELLFKYCKMDFIYKIYGNTQGGR